MHDKIERNAYVIASNISTVLLSVHDSTPEFAWKAAEAISGMSKKQLYNVGYRLRHIKFTFLEQD